LEPVSAPIPGTKIQSSILENTRLFFNGNIDFKIALFWFRLLPTNVATHQGIKRKKIDSPFCFTSPDTDTLAVFSLGAQLLHNVLHGVNNKVAYEASQDGLNALTPMVMNFLIVVGAFPNACCCVKRIYSGTDFKGSPRPIKPPCRHHH